MNLIKNFKDYKLISENMKYHLDNDISFTKNVFRVGSESFYSLLEEVRNVYDKGIIQLSDLDKELYEATDIGKFGIYNDVKVPLDIPMLNDKVFEKKHDYKGSKVKINKPTRSSGPKKYKVYVKNPDTGNIIKVNFGDSKGGLISKVNDPEARKSFVSRHNCSQKKDKTTAGYWSCRLPKFKNLVDTDYSGYW